MKPISIALSIAVVLGSNIGLASSDDLPPSYQPSRHQVMAAAASEFHASYEVLRNISDCESGGSMSAVGKEEEIGDFQFKQSTFDGMSKEMGEKMNIHSLVDQSRLFSYVAASHPSWLSQWSTWRAWYGRGLNRCRV